jgi:hypothetical protein
LSQHQDIAIEALPQAILQAGEVAGAACAARSVAARPASRQLLAGGPLRGRRSGGESDRAGLVRAC